MYVHGWVGKDAVDNAKVSSWRVGSWRKTQTETLGDGWEVWEEEKESGGWMLS